MQWKHTGVLVVALLVISGIALGIAPLKSTVIKFPVATDMGKCPSGVQPLNCMDDVGETPKWHYHDGGTVSMIGGGGGSTGNWTFSSNAADLTGAAVMSLGPSTATGISLLGGALKLDTSNYSYLALYSSASVLGVYDSDVDGILGFAGTLKLLAGSSTILNISSSGVVPNVDSTYPLGGPDYRFTLGYFGAAVASQPTCDVDHRGATMPVFGGAGTADTFQWCGKNVAGSYSWQTVYTAL